MKAKVKVNYLTLIFAIVVCLTFVGCSYRSSIEFPPANDLFVTTGDGDIQKPYTPIGQIIYYKASPAIGIPLFNLFVPTTDPEVEMNTGFMRMVREMGADAVINTSLDWKPPSSFLSRLLGWGHGGKVLIQGTAIKR